MTKEIEIAGRKIGANHPPYIIAELSANHNGSLDRALEIITSAKACGADCVKLQTYTADTLTLDVHKPDFRIEGGLWDGEYLYNLYERAYTPWDWFPKMFDHARKIGITIFSSPFDNTAVDLLEELNAPAYKIASFEAIDLPLIEYVASKGKPMIISTGLADAEEIQEAVDAARGAGCEEIAILQCVSGYPAPATDYNLLTIPNMIERFGCIVGLSDHTIDNTTAVASVALGASVIEKHFTLDRSAGGPDDSFSLEPGDLVDLCTSAKVAWSARGAVDYGHKSSEKGNVKFRRSLYVVQDIRAGEAFTPGNVRSIRPGFGLAPKHLSKVMGRTASTNIERGTALSWDLLSEASD